MFKNVASTFVVFAFDATTNVPKTGDAANITAYVSKDYGTVTVLGDTSATEFDATNAPGYYWFTAAQAETNGDCLMVTAKSATANIKVLGAPAIIYTRPTTGWLAPTTAGRTLDVSAGGEAGVDWANVGTPSTSVNLSATTINLANTVTTYTGNTVQTGDSFARIGAAGVGLTAVALTGTQTFNNTGTWTGNIVGTLSTLTTYTGNTPQTGDSFGRLGAPSGASISADIQTRLATSGYTAPPTAAQNATAVLTTQMTESYAALHAAPTLAQIAFESRSLLAAKSVATTTLTAYKMDGVTIAGTYTLSDAVSPVSINRAT